MLVEADDTGQTLREYVWLDDMPLAVVSDVNTMSPNLYFVHADHLDTPMRMTDASKTVVWDAFFLPFDTVQSITGTATNNLRFPGQYFLIEDGLHYNWYRHYDPTLGRYVQADPLGFVAGPSLYAYASLAPTIKIDPTGRQEDTVIGRPRPVLPDIWDEWKKHADRSVKDIWNFCRRIIARLGGDGGDDKQHCEELNRIDTDTCNGITRRRGARAGAVCHASASERLAACLSGKSIPPLNTWSN